MSIAADPAADARFMAVALGLGRRGLGRTWPNPAVGAVLVKDGVMVGRGWTQAGGRPHAEVEALRRADGAARGATLYVTLEPCSHYGKSPPCADAVIAAGVTRVVSALEDPNPEVAGQGHARLRAAGISVEVGVGGATARHDHAGHIRRMTAGRPNVLLKLAISADGKAAGPGRRPVAITGEAVSTRVHLLRARSDAIMIGIGTALADDPLLTCRLSGMADRSPVRVIAAGDLRLPLSSRLVETASQTPVWVLTGADAPRQAEAALVARGVEVMRLPSRPGGLDLDKALEFLATRGIARLMVEGGPALAASLLGGDLVDEAVLFHAATVIGADGVEALDPKAFAALQAHLHRVSSEGVGADREDRYERR